MDALFTIPMLSFLLIPSMTSYGTSLNVLFFYITWTTLVLSHPPLRVELIGTAAVRLIFFIVPSLLFFLFDTLVPSAAAVIKVHGDDGLPAGRRLKSGIKEAKVAAWAVFNVFLGVAVQGVLEFILTHVLQMKSALKVSTTLPLPWGIAKDLIRGLLVREVLQYALHRFVLHSKAPVFAARHTSWYHSLRTPYPLTAHYDHPVTYLISRVLPTFAPAALFRYHLLTYLLYLVIVSLEETFAYSGYKPMPTSFFIGGIARRVDSHLASNGRGNFGAYGFLDWALGTSVGEDEGGEDKSEVSEDMDIDEIAQKILERQLRKRKGGKSRTRRVQD